MSNYSLSLFRRVLRVAAGLVVGVGTVAAFFGGLVLFLSRRK